MFHGPTYAGYGAVIGDLGARLNSKGLEQLGFWFALEIALLRLC